MSPKALFAIPSGGNVRVDILASFFGLLILWPVLLIVAIMVKIKMPGGPALTFGRACSRSAMLKQAWTLLSLTRSLFLTEACGQGWEAVHLP